MELMYFISIGYTKIEIAEFRENNSIDEYKIDFINFE